MAKTMKIKVKISKKDVAKAFKIVDVELTPELWEELSKKYISLDIDNSNAFPETEKAMLKLNLIYIAALSLD